MADEIGEAYERLLAFLPEETRAMLGNAKHILGMTQLVAENAKRCRMVPLHSGRGQVDSRTAPRV